MCASVLEMRWYNSFHHIPCSEPVLEFRLFGVSTRKSVLIHQTHLSTSVPIGCDEQWHNSSSLKMFWSRHAHACCIEPMGLGKFAHRAVVLGEPACSALDGQSKG